MKPILVLDANQRSALATTRSLGRHRITVLTAEETPTSLAGASRYAATHHIYPSPQQQPHAFIDCILEIVRQYDIGMLLPMTELTTELLASARKRFPDIILPFPDVDCVNKLADKCRLIKASKQLGIPTPDSRIHQDYQQALEELDSLHYPLVLKPGKSWVCTKGSWQRVAVKIADSVTQAHEILDNDNAFHQNAFMLQQCIEGHGAGIFAIYQHGQAKAFFAHKRLREKPPRGGVSVLSESIETDQQMLQYAKTLLDSVNWHGVAMVEFKVADDGTPYLMEVNTRFWGSLQLAIDAGVDFPWLLYQISTGQDVEPVQHYRTGIRLRWLLGDVDSLYLTLRDKRYPLTHKLKTLWQFMLPSFKTRHEINRWHDMGPAWFEIRQYLRDILG